MLRWTCAVGVILSITMSGAVLAKGKAKSKAVTLYQEAVELAKEEKYEAAILLFNEALEAGAPSVTYYNIAKCHESLGDLESAVDNYQAYLESPDATDVQEVQETIETLQATPSDVSIESEPEGVQVTEVLEDGNEEPLGQTPLQLQADAGAHTYRLSMEGYESSEVTVEAGLGKEQAVEVQLDEVEPPPEPEKPEPPGDALGVAVQVGGGASITAAKDLAQPGGAVTLAAAYRFAHAVETGFAVGLRFDLRPFSLEGTDEGGDAVYYPGLFTAIQAVPAYQFKVHRRLGVELSLPIGLAILNATRTVPSSATLDLVGGTIRGGGLVLFDVGLAAALRIWVVQGLFICAEPVRLHLMVPVTKWLSDNEVVAGVDFSVHVGWEF